MINYWGSTIPFYDEEKQNEKNEIAPSLTPYLLNDGAKHGCVIVFPGGGYSNRAAHEAEPIALWLNSAGLSAFVLNYRVAPYGYPTQLADAQRAVRFVRHNCGEYNVFPNKIGVLGFSAGGHLASSLATCYAYGCYKPNDGIDAVSARPDAAVLCYAVISMKSMAHSGSVTKLLGENPAPELLAKLSGEEAAHAEMPPVFIWHTVEDKSVPVENALMMAQALRKHGVPFECHIFNTGRHGLGLARDIPVTESWTELCGKWLRSTFEL